jgi:hypothetical protein
VRSNTVGYAAAADDPGVIMISGYSPALMKFVLSGEIISPESPRILRNVAQVISPQRCATLRKILGDSGLDDVRVALNAMPAASFLCV